ncbi:MAG: AAA family ATPase, partial [Chloroflexota bacterium]
MTTAKGTRSLYREFLIEEFIIDEEPFYVPVKDEIELFEAAYAQKIPVLLKGPTGCGKTRFVEYMAWRLGQPFSTARHQNSNAPNGMESRPVPLITIACHEDLTASDLVGRYLLEGEETK